MRIRDWSSDVCSSDRPEFEPHPIQGWTPDFIHYVLQEAVDQRLYDEVVPVAGPEGIKWARELAQREGIFTGISGGATFAVARQVAERADPGAVVLCVLPDTGERYLSTPLFDRNKAGARFGDSRVGIACASDW